MLILIGLGGCQDEFEIKLSDGSRASSMLSRSCPAVIIQSSLINYQRLICHLSVRQGSVLPVMGVLVLSSVSLSNLIKQILSKPCYFGV